MSVFARERRPAFKVEPLMRTDSLVQLEDELQEEFSRLFPRVGEMRMEDPARSWVIGSMCNLAKCAFGAYRTPAATGFVEHTIEHTTMKHLNRDWMLRTMAGVLKIELKEVKDRNNSGSFLDCYRQPYIAFTTGDTLVRSDIVPDSSDPIQNPTHYLCLRKRHLETDNGATLGVRLYAKARGGWRSFVNAFRKDTHLGRAELKIDQFRTSEVHEMEVPLSQGMQNVVVRFSVQLISMDAALNEMNKDETSNSWSETSENFEQELEWPELALMTDIGHINIEPVAFVDAQSTGTQAWIHVNMRSKIVFVAFRGTETSEFKDIATDASCLPAQCSAAMRSDRYVPKPTKTLLDGRIKLHTGFRNAYESIRESVLRIVYDITGWNESWTVCVTGHSLGGALATICAFELRNRRLTTAPNAPALRQNFSLRRAVSSFFMWSSRNEEPELRLGPKVAMVSFGAPCVGNKVFTQLFDETVRLSLRIFTEGDPIVRILPFYYTHVKHQIVIQPDGEVHLSGKSFQLGRSSEIRQRILKSLECYEELEVTDREHSGVSFSNHRQPQYFNNIKATVEQFFARDLQLRGHPMRVLRTRELSTIPSVPSVPSLQSESSIPRPSCVSPCP